MKAVILAGGLGTRISEETHLKPKPMIEIGGKPILWHIMKIYSAYDINEFVICCGYKGYMIKEYFVNYYLHSSDISIDLQKNSVDILKKNSESWKITLVDTGIDTMTGGRLKRIEKYLDDEDFCFTYGDGLANVDIPSLLKFHQNSKKLATLTAVQPPGRYGLLELDGNHVSSFVEKPSGDGNWINGGFFVLKPGVFDYIKDDATIWEKESLEKLTSDRELMAFKHSGFFQPVDTLRDKNLLENLWNRKQAPWKNW